MAIFDTGVYHKSTKPPDPCMLHLNYLHLLYFYGKSIGNDPMTLDPMGLCENN